MDLRWRCEWKVKKSYMLTWDNVSAAIPDIDAARRFGSSPECALPGPLRPYMQVPNAHRGPGAPARALDISAFRVLSPDKTRLRVIREIRDLPLLSAITLTVRNARELPRFACCGSEKDPEIGCGTTMRCTPKTVPPATKGARTGWPHTGSRWKEGEGESGNSA